MIDFRDFSFTYPPRGIDERGRSLDSLDLSIKKGDFILLSGGSGSGKSSLLLALSGMIPHVTGGKIKGDLLIEGREIRQYYPSDLAHTMGLAFQNPHTQLFTPTVKEEIAFSLQNRGSPRSEMEGIIKKSLAFVHLSGYEDRSPRTLSGGEKQRLLLAILFAQNPPVYLLDEPLSALDPAGFDQMFELLIELNRQGKTIVLAEKRELPLLERSSADEGINRVVRLEKGAISFVGSPREYGQKKGTAQKRKHSGSSDIDAENSLLLESIGFGYPGRESLFEEFSLLCPGGQVTALVGANGSGKSTLASLAMGIMKPQRGRVLFGGREITYSSVAERAGYLGYLFQNPDNQLFAPTLEEEVAFGVSHLPIQERADRVHRSLALFSLTELRDIPPALLSFALRKRVALASLYAMEPRFSLLDEPDWGQDPEGIEMIKLYTDEVTQKGRGVLLISHDRHLVDELAHQVVSLEGGVL